MECGRAYSSIDFCFGVAEVFWGLLQFHMNFLPLWKAPWEFWSGLYFFYKFPCYIDDFHNINHTNPWAWDIFSFSSMSFIRDWKFWLKGTFTSLVKFIPRFSYSITDGRVRMISLLGCLVLVGRETNDFLKFVLYPTTSSVSRHFVVKFWYLCCLISCDFQRGTV